MEFIKPGINVNFIGKRKAAYVLSGVLIALTVFLLIWRGGPNYGVDFAGGVLIQVKMDRGYTPSELREAFNSEVLRDSIIQEFGEEGEFEYLIRIRQTDVEMAGLGEKVREELSTRFGSENVDIRRIEMVGPKVGKDLQTKALDAIFFAILFIATYISGRFEQKWMMSIIMALSLTVVVLVASSFGVGITWLIICALIVTLALCWFLNLKYAMGAIVALIHDVTITLGAFALFDKEISLTIIAALLTIVGYSLNDTIVVFDRIRENTRRYRRRRFEQVMNSSINETLSRTFLTSLTTLIVVVALFVLGGGVIHDFAFALLVGVLVGTYSSVFVASPILLLWEERLEGTTKAS